VAVTGPAFFSSASTWPDAVPFPVLPFGSDFDTLHLAFVSLL